MKTGLIVAIVIVVAVLSLALGAAMGYSISSGRTSTTTQTGKTSTTTQTYTITTSVLLESSSTTSNSSESAQTSLDTTFTTNFYYWIAVNYSGSWTLEYLSTNGTVTFDVYNVIQYNVRGYLNGSGNYETRITTYGVGYVENTLCAIATKLDSSQNNLTLTVLNMTNSTTTSDPKVEVCATYGV